MEALDQDDLDQDEAQADQDEIGQASALEALLRVLFVLRAAPVRARNM